MKQKVAGRCGFLGSMVRFSYPTAIQLAAWSPVFIWGTGGPSMKKAA